MKYVSSSNIWWNVNCTCSVSSLTAHAGSLSLGASTSLHTVLLKFPHTHPDKAILESTSFTYNPPAVSYVIFMAISRGKIHKQVLRGQKKKNQRKTLVRVNRLTCRERQGFPTSDLGHWSHLQHHCSVPVPMALVRRPWADVNSKLELPLPSSCHHWDGRHLLPGVSYQHCWRMGKALASCPASPQVWGWPGTKAFRITINKDPMLLAQDAKILLKA